MMHRSAIRILRKVFVTAFYRENSGFFLFWFFVLFGTVSGSQLISYHLSLIQGMITSDVFLAIVIFAWFLYMVKCAGFAIRLLADERQHFLIVLNTLPFRTQFRYMVFVQLLIYAPVWIYAAVVVSIALKQHLYGPATLVILSNLLFVFFSSRICLRYLQRNPVAFLKNIFQTRYLVPKPFFSIPLWFLWKERTQMLLVTKTFSLLLLYAVIYFYRPEQHDIRPLLLIMLLIALAHIAVILQLHRFEEERLVFSKNLPIPFLKKFGWLLLLYFFLLLPELVFVWKGFHKDFQLSDFPQLLLFLTGLPVFFHTVLFTKNMNDTSYYRLAFMLSAVLFFVILYNPGILLPLIVLLVSFILYRTHLYDYEKEAGF